MTEKQASGPAYVVLRRAGDGRYELVGEVRRRSGLTARAARAQAVRDATGGEPEAGVAYAAILRSEWRIAFDLWAQK